MQYTKEEIEKYASSLARVGSLSNLFSESITPFIHYRATEYLYARTMGANNLARSDIAIDAKRGSVGVGIKTFVYSGRPKFEKVAEFNKEIESFHELSDLEKVLQISKLRNTRIAFAGRATDVDSFIYHCIARLPGKIIVFEEEMPFINTDNVSVLSVKGKNISFTDGRANYRFNTSKSTLFKEFRFADNLFEKQIKIYDDPFKLLESIDFSERPTIIGAPTEQKNIQQLKSITLPLYGRKGEVFEGSGLNQWNAKGRKRNPNEIYIPNPVEAQKKSPNFFPPRDTSFDLQLPNGKIMQAKISQEGDKALMSNPNSALGEWLLRDVLALKVGTLVTRDLLNEIGIDSVEITKEGDNYSIDFKEVGSYESFLDL